MSATVELPRAVAEARVTCPAYPWQAEGRLWDGPWFYLRIRSGWASLGLGASVSDAVDDGIDKPRIIEGVPWVPTDAEAWALFDRLLAMRPNTTSRESVRAEEST